MTSKKLDMRAMLAAVDEPEPTPTTDAEPPAPAAAPTPIQTKAVAKPRKAPPAAAAEGPRWTNFEARSTRLREDQVDALADLGRRLKNNRINKTERITESTLVRIAVDLLLAEQHRLVGDTEAELTASLGVKP